MNQQSKVKVWEGGAKKDAYSYLHTAVMNRQASVFCCVNTKLFIRIMFPLLYRIQFGMFRKLENADMTIISRRVSKLGGKGCM